LEALETAAHLILCTGVELPRAISSYRII